MTRKGVIVSLNSDSAELMRHLNDEAAKMMKYGGLDETEALSLITINPAKQLMLDAGQAGTLVASLCAVPLNRDDSYAGGIARWLQQSLAPAVNISVDDFDAGLVASLAGVRGDLPARTMVSWEQTTYTLDLTTAEVRRLTRVLERLQADSIGLTLTLERAAETLGARTVTLADVKGTTASLATVQAAPETRQSRRDVVGKSIQDLSKITSPKDLNKAARIADALYELVDDVLADALISVTYALSLGDPQGTTLLSGNVSRRHDFGFSKKKSETRVRAPWAEPEPQV